MPRKKRPSSYQDISNRQVGSNQHRERPIVEDLPELGEILQQYIDDNIRQIDIPDRIERDHGVKMRLRTVQKYMKELGVLTKRRNGLTADQQAIAINVVAQEDPLGRWGGRLIQEKLGQRSIHIARKNVLAYRKEQDSEATSARDPKTRKIHHKGLWSIGPNEEWCIDGHEKILLSMGIAVWGVIDKFSRLELGLWAMPNARLKELPPALYLRLLKKQGGMPLTTVGDKGSELSLLIPLVTTLRQKFQPYLTEEQLPAFKAVKSVFNITRERAWRTLWEKELGNIAHEYKIGMATVGFVENDDIHAAVSHWLWGRIVQLRLDQVLHEHRIHKVRKQKGRLLPSGARREDMYESPDKFGVKNNLIEIPSEYIDELLLEYDRPDLLQFGSDETVRLLEGIFADIGSPELSAKAGWRVFKEMVNYYINSDE